MAMFGASPRESYDALYGVLNQPADTTALEREQAPGFFAGDMSGALGTGVYRGLSRGAATAANVATPAMRPIAKSIDELFGTSTDEWLLGEQDKANRALTESKLDPKTSGMAAQVLYGLGDVLTTVGSTGGNPYAAGGLYGLTQAQIGMSEGLDITTALAKGGIEGLAMGVSVGLPAALSGNLAFRMATGGALNVGVGIPERAAVSTLLNARGYPEMAKQYAPLDSAAIVTELVLGAAFGGLLGPRARSGVKLPPPEAVPPSAVDAALTANQATHAEIHTAPGVPTNTRSRQSHAAALDSAVESLVMGRDVSVEALLKDAGFLGKRPDFDAMRVIADELEKAGAGDVLAKLREVEAEARGRGLYVEPDTLGSVVLSEKPVESSVAGTAGRESQVRIGDEYVPTRLTLVEAGDIAATMTKADNQFRDRTRLASEQQIQDIASRLDAHLLMDAPVMDYGAPVLAADGTVIGGNGRKEAIGLAYERGTAGAYREALRAEFGDAVDGMQRPMLVRVLQRDVDVAKAAILSNEGQALRMSALEQAKVDAERLGDFRAFEFGEDGGVDLVANMPFIRAWAEQMPPGQRAAIMDADGKLSAEGAGRLRNAILYRAYGDSPTLSRLVEATDPGSRNIAAALTRAAPAVADAREAIARGDLYPMGLHDDLVLAVEKMDALRRSGMGVGDWVKQLDAFGDGMTAEARLLVQFMDQNIRASRAVSDGVLGYYRLLTEAGNPKQGSMFEASQPDKGRMLALALEAPMYGRGAGGASKAADLTVAFRAMFGRDADRLLETGRVKVVQSVKNLPGSGHPSDVGGMFWKGKAYVVADNTGLAQIRGRVLHEIGEHAGMEQMLGADLYAETLRRIEAKVGTDPVFKEARALAEARANRPEHVSAETLAYLVENAPELPVVRRVLAQVRQWLYRVTGGRFVDLTQADLQMMAVASLRRYAREAEVADRGDAPWYMTLFHGTPNPFKPEPGAPLGSLRWKYINTGEGAQAFGYGHYIAQQEWIARTRYRDRLVQRKASEATMEIDTPDGKLTITGEDEPAWRIGDRLVHNKMGGDAGDLASAIWLVNRMGYDRAKANGGLPQVLRALDEVTVDAPREISADSPLLDVIYNEARAANNKVYYQIEDFINDLRTFGKFDMSAKDYPAAASYIKERLQAGMRVLRSDITEVKPEPPKGALYGKFIPDDVWNQMMIWDAPLSKQPENVREAFRKLGIDPGKKLEWEQGSSSDWFTLNDDIRIEERKDGFHLFVDGKDKGGYISLREAQKAAEGGATISGESAYRRLAREVRTVGRDPSEPINAYVQRAFDDISARRDDSAEFNEEEIASVILHQLGVPGHRFLDGETRAAGWDSPDAKFNVVLFSDDLGRVAWEARNNDTEWVTANGKGRIVKRDAFYDIYIDGKQGMSYPSIESATAAAERELDGQLYSRTSDGDIIEDTTMPGARAMSDQADAEIAQANELSQGFLPAVECFLRVGE